MLIMLFRRHATDFDIIYHFRANCSGFLQQKNFKLLCWPIISLDQSAPPPLINMPAEPQLSEDVLIVS
jgi:hypothetical protein